MPEQDQRPPPRIHRGAVLSSASALALLIVMFALEWYGVAGVPDPSAARPAVSTAENAWNGLPIVRWAMLATILLTLGSLVLRASQRSHGTKTDTSRLVAAFGALTSVLLTYRVLIELPASDRVLDQKLGAFLGLLCAFGIALGGWDSVREQRQGSAGAARHSRRAGRFASGGDAR
ncbi:MAG TPA: hypothetical protein VIL82_07135 [Solirubrobacteraceae bacterium]|jgi:hypothetical protein